MILDSNQIIIEKKLNDLAFSLDSEEKNSFFIKRFLPNFLSDFLPKEKQNIKSLYIYGDVGRGKSMLVKKFYNSIKKTPKKYVHFNSFMQLIHENLHKIRQESKKDAKKYQDELIESVKRVVGDKKLICFDEFQVTDIADAMLLSRIFSYLFLQKIIVVFTSNSKPKDLYQNGLQREVFLEFVNKILLKNSEILFLDSKIDYRTKYCQSLTKRYFVEDENSNIEIEKIIKKLTDNKPFKPLKIKVWGRDLELKNTCDKILLVNFDELCYNSLAASDYKAICNNFNLIILLQIPKLSPEDVNEAKRFVLFIDEIYENKVALIALAKTNPENIYESGIGQKAFKRTISRLNEIKSDNYWQNSKINL